jgi:hypothetical protein
MGNTSWVRNSGEYDKVTNCEVLSHLSELPMYLGVKCKGWTRQLSVCASRTVFGDSARRHLWLTAETDLDYLVL